MPVISGGLVGSPGRVLCEEVSFTETAGASAYTGDVHLPAGAYIVDILVHGVAVWDNAAGVGMVVGDFTDVAVPVEIDADGFLTITSLKAAGDLVAGETLSISGGTNVAGAEEGAYFTATTVQKRYSASARIIRGVITAAGAGGSTGRTRMLVMYTDPTVATVATKA
jgi:hypothetical protein